MPEKPAGLCPKQAAISSSEEFGEHATGRKSALLLASALEQAAIE
jgi:hypothetical protein